MVNSAQKVVEGCFRLQVDQMKCVEKIECECRLGNFQGCREPSLSKQLYWAVWATLASAVAKMYSMDPANVHNCEFIDLTEQIWAMKTRVIEMHLEPEVIEATIFEKVVIPDLIHK